MRKITSCVAALVAALAVAAPARASQTQPDSFYVQHACSATTIYARAWFDQMGYAGPPIYCFGGSHLWDPSLNVMDDYFYWSGNVVLCPSAPVLKYEARVSNSGGVQLVNAWQIAC